MGIEEEKKEEQSQVRIVQYDLTVKCSVCGGENKVIFVPHFGNETFVCSKCMNTNRIIMTFIAIAENPPGVRTMMVKPNERRIGEVRRNVSNFDISNRRANNS